MKITLEQPGTYRICVSGRLNAAWTGYFEEMAISETGDTNGTILTMLTGELPDQAAVQGVLQKLYNLGFPLISVLLIQGGCRESASQYQPGSSRQ
jgi:hypothetical protein